MLLYTTFWLVLSGICGHAQNKQPVSTGELNLQCEVLARMEWDAQNVRHSHLVKSPKEFVAVVSTEDGRLLLLERNGVWRSLRLRYPNGDPWAVGAVDTYYVSKSGKIVIAEDNGGRMAVIRISAPAELSAVAVWLPSTHIQSLESPWVAGTNLASVHIAEDERSLLLSYQDGLVGTLNVSEPNLFRTLIEAEWRLAKDNAKRTSMLGEWAIKEYHEYKPQAVRPRIATNPRLRIPIGLRKQDWIYFDTRKVVQARFDRHTNRVLQAGAADACILDMQRVALLYKTTSSVYCKISSLDDSAKHPESIVEIPNLDHRYPLRIVDCCNSAEGARVAVAGQHAIAILEYAESGLHARTRRFSVPNASAVPFVFDRLEGTLSYMELSEGTIQKLGTKRFD